MHMSVFQEDNAPSSAEEEPPQQAFSPAKQSRDSNPLPSKPPQPQEKIPKANTPIPVAAVASPNSRSPHSERSNPSPALSESNTVSSHSSSSCASTVNTISSALSNSNSKENKDKKKTRNNKKDVKKSQFISKSYCSCWSFERVKEWFMQFKRLF